MLKTFLMWLAEGAVVVLMAGLVAYSLVVFSNEYPKPYTSAGCVK